MAEKNRLAEEETLLLSHKNCEVEQKISKLRINARKTEEEKMGLEKRTQDAELLTFKLAEESKKRTLEADRLKNELILAKVAEKEAKERLLTYLTQSMEVEVIDDRDSKCEWNFFLFLMIRSFDTFFYSFLYFNGPRHGSALF